VNDNYIFWYFGHDMTLTVRDELGIMIKTAESMLLKQRMMRMRTKKQMKRRKMSMGEGKCAQL